MKVFISHSSANVEISEKICRYLEKNGHSCFFAPRDIRSGFPYAEEIMNGIDSSNAVILVLSEKSNESPHVLREIERAVSLDLPIIVYKTEEVTLTKSMEYFLMSHQWLNNDTDTDISELLTAVNGIDAKEAKLAKAADAGTSTVKGKKNPLPVAGYIAVLVGAIVLVALLIIFATSGGAGNSSTAQNSSSSVTDSSSETQKPEDGTTSSAVSLPASAELGDTVTLGTYNGLPIKWRIIEIKDGNALLISDDILTMKAYDAAESGKYNFIGNDDYWNEDISELPVMTQQKLRGSNQWHLSNIRTWLNSDRENVKYDDQPPTNAAMSDLKNGYDKEPGFLNSFTKEEKEAILPTPILTNNVDMNVTTEDMVFLLSKDELELLDKADVSIAAKPTEKAVEQNKSPIYKAYSLDMGVEDHYWWLRDNGGAAGYEGYLVCNSYGENKVINYIVGVEGFGIRPAMRVKLSSDIVRQNIS